MKRAGIAAVFIYLSAHAATAADFSWTVSPGSREVFQGGVVRIEVTGKDIAEVKGWIRDQELWFFPESPTSYATLLGVDLEERAAPIALLVTARARDGGRSEETIVLHVKEREFPKEDISVPPQFDRIDEATQNRIDKERARLARFWKLPAGPRLWEHGFTAPVPGEVTSPFGLRRIINGSPRSPHSGVDLKAGLGADVVATNHGRVVLREELFFTGKSIVLDHGAGLYTMYFHLSDFLVQENAAVRKGDLIARAGMSGRVTGPHLHWGARLNGARIDPFGLLRPMP